MLYNTFLAATGGAGYSSCNKMISKSFYQETVLYYFLIEMFDFYQKEQR